jgi:hypothetical protein
MRPFTDPAPMALTLGVWLCAFPFVLLVVGWLWGLIIEALAALEKEVNDHETTHDPGDRAGPGSVL